MLNLRDVVEEIDDFDDELTIYAAPEWTPDSTVVVAREPDEGGVPLEAASVGMQYFLEIAIAKEVLAGLTALELAARQATALGFSRRIAPHRTPFNSHGRPAFTDGSRYISRDVDAHSGGAWKMFDRRGRRLGTYNEDLTVRIGD